MPQLNRGGKFVFGISVIHDDLSIHFPPQAIEEYKITSEDKIIIFTGSKTTGGFCVTNYTMISNSKLGHILRDCPNLENCSVSQGTLVPYKGRRYAWLSINKKGVIHLTPNLIEQLDITIGTELLSIRSSDIAFTMGAKGPLLDKAYHYNGIINRY